jgi:hypothetical protein
MRIGPNGPIASVSRQSRSFGRPEPRRGVTVLPLIRYVYPPLNLITAEDGTGIPGGVGGGPGYRSHAVFYVGVPVVEAALQRAERLGGIRVMGPATSPSGLVVGHFRDPEGTLIGVAGVA